MAFKSPQTEHFPLILGRKELLGWQFRKKGGDFAAVLVGKGRGRRAGSPCPLPVLGLPLQHFPPFPPVSSCPAPLPPRRPPRLSPLPLSKAGLKKRNKTQTGPSSPRADQAGDVSRTATIPASRCSSRPGPFTMFIPVGSRRAEPPGVGQGLWAGLEVLGAAGALAHR